MNKDDYDEYLITMEKFEKLETEIHSILLEWVSVFARLKGYNYVITSHHMYEDGIWCQYLIQFSRCGDEIESMKIPKEFLFLDKEHRTRMIEEKKNLIE